MEDQYYMQDSRSYVGNDALWWAEDGNGYTTDVSWAEIFTKERAMRQHNQRETDIPWPKDYIDSITRPAVAFQYMDNEKALVNT